MIRRAARALRLQDWSVQLLIHWACAVAYAIATPQPAYPYASVIGWTTALGASAMTAGYLLNNVSDYRSDAYKPRPYFHTRTGVAAAAFAGTALIALSLGWVHATAQIVWVPLVAWAQLVIGIGYSLPPLRFKERGALGLITAATSQRLPTFLMLAVAAPAFDPVATVLLAIWLTIVGLLFIVEHQLEDLDSDRRSGTRTWMTAAGRERGVRLRRRIYELLGAATALIALCLLIRRPTALGLAAGSSWAAAACLLAVTVRRHYSRRPA